ncbi:alpha/beta fold hydrolase [Acrocarpospora catenulata]|uniref:alpha/beta fold hydrolase n=1 Tax=Acrocarpospora catenulata TaxID=2836182 RepID=UPI001BDAE128|nr:alpha/beta hydrolase [Acrocarpospora catenulata]
MSETFVLIAGGWHGGWAWRPVAQYLRAAGHRVLAPTMPGLNDGDDPTAYELCDVISYVVDLVERKDLRDVTLVGHSWAGYVITGAVPRLVSRLRKVVYWSAFVPAEGVPLFGEVPPPLQDLLTTLARQSADNTVLMPLERWRQAFMQDATPDAQGIVHSLLVPQPFQYLTTPVAPVDFARLGVPAGYVLTTEDITLTPTDWTRFTGRLGLTPTLAPGSHEACFTQPDSLARALLTA